VKKYSVKKSELEDGVAIDVGDGVGIEELMDLVTKQYGRHNWYEIHIVEDANIPGWYNTLSYISNKEYVAKAKERRYSLEDLLKETPPGKQIKHLKGEIQKGKDK